MMTTLRTPETATGLFDRLASIHMQRRHAMAELHRLSEELTGLEGEWDDLEPRAVGLLERSECRAVVARGFDDGRLADVTFTLLDDGDLLAREVMPRNEVLMLDVTPLPGIFEAASAVAG